MFSITRLYYQILFFQVFEKNKSSKSLFCNLTLIFKSLNEHTKYNETDKPVISLQINLLII